MPGWVWLFPIVIANIITTNNAHAGATHGAICVVVNFNYPVNNFLENSFSVELMILKKDIIC